MIELAERLIGVLLKHFIGWKKIFLLFWEIEPRSICVNVISKDGTLKAVRKLTFLLSVTIYDKRGKQNEMQKRLDKA